MFIRMQEVALQDFVLSYFISELFWEALGMNGLMKMEEPPHKCVFCNLYDLYIKKNIV